MKSERRAAVDAPPGYRNGHGKLRRLAEFGDDRGEAASGQGPGGTVREPGAAVVPAPDARADPGAVPARAGRGRLRAGLEGAVGRRGAVVEVLGGAAQGEVDGGARGVEPPAAGRPRTGVRVGGRDLREGGSEKDKAALLVVIGAMSDGTKEVLAVTPGYRESTASWSAVLRDLKARGLATPRLLVADGNLGIWGAAREVWPGPPSSGAGTTRRPTCWTGCRKGSRRWRGRCCARRTALAGRQRGASGRGRAELRPLKDDPPRPSTKPQRTGTSNDQRRSRAMPRSGCARRGEAPSPSATALIWRLLVAPEAQRSRACGGTREEGSRTETRRSEGRRRPFTHLLTRPLLCAGSPGPTGRLYRPSIHLEQRGAGHVVFFVVDVDNPARFPHLTAHA